MEISNAKIARLLRQIAAALIIKKIGNIFQIRAYENAADAIEHSTSDVADLWQEGKLDTVPGVGEKLKEYLSELFKAGRVKHFEDVQKGIPQVVFDLLDIPGIGPKTAQKIAELGVKNLEDLKKKLKSGELVSKGFSSKIAENIQSSFQHLNSKDRRMLLPYAAFQADKILNYLKKCPGVLQAHSLGSLRRMAATIGDLDFSASSNAGEKVVDHFCKMPGVESIIDQGESKATVVLNTGLQLDLLVAAPESYGALLQHFTGSKAHNIKLRTLANQKGFSLSEYGVRSIRHPRSNRGSINNKDNNVISTKTEEELYSLLGMQTPLPEIREDTGEIEVALEHNLPAFLEFKDIKGDLHLHSNFPIKNPSHGPGVNSMEEIVRKAESLGYQFAGISDHPPGFTTTSKAESIDWVQKRTKFIHNLKSRTKSIRVLNGLEIDILGDGSLSVPNEALAFLDYCIAGIHSGHRGSKEKITNRLIKALENPYVDIISHPTNRLLNERDSSEADWEKVFKATAKNNKILEINSFPDRLDLRDDLVRQALKFGVKFIVNTDAHEVAQMDNMRFGVAVARRGWATKKDIVNTWDWTDFAKWFKLIN